MYVAMYLRSEAQLSVPVHKSLSVTKVLNQGGAGDYSKVLDVRV